MSVESVVSTVLGEPRYGVGSVVHVCVAVCGSTELFLLEKGVC